MSAGYRADFTSPLRRSVRAKPRSEPADRHAKTSVKFDHGVPNLIAYRAMPRPCHDSPRPTPISARRISRRIISVVSSSVRGSGGGRFGIARKRTGELRARAFVSRLSAKSAQHLSSIRFLATGTSPMVARRASHRLRTTLNRVLIAAIGGPSRKILGKRSGRYRFVNANQIRNSHLNL